MSGTGAEGANGPLAPGRAALKEREFPTAVETVEFLSGPVFFSSDSFRREYLP